MTVTKESQHCLVSAGQGHTELSSKVYQLLADINTSIYNGTCGKIGGSKPQLIHKQVGRIITTVILDVRKLKQKS